MFLQKEINQGNALKPKFGASNKYVKSDSLLKLTICFRFAEQFVVHQLFTNAHHDVFCPWKLPRLLSFFNSKRPPPLKHT